jgi:hypothetical protein
MKVVIVVYRANDVARRRAHSSVLSFASAPIHFMPDNLNRRVNAASVKRQTRTVINYNGLIEQPIR